MMQTGFRGTFVISWMQTDLDGQVAAPVASLRRGQCWRWSGEAARVDGPQDVLRLADPERMVDLRHRVGRVARRLLTAAEVDPRRWETANTEAEAGLVGDGFTVTDGRRSWAVKLIDANCAKAPLIAFGNGIPPRNTELWVVSVGLTSDRQDAGNVVCFTPGTMILTETGPVAVEALTEEDRVQTGDNGCQPLLWIGRRRITGARMRAIPQLAPVRLRRGALDRGALDRGALDRDIPDAGLLVSPDHRLVLRGARARALFDTDEVLVAARDLVNDHTIRVDRSLSEVTYIHFLLPRHEIVFANGVETDSFHPEGAASDETLAAFFPYPATYGGFARRVLSKGEAAILRHDMA